MFLKRLPARVEKPFQMKPKRLSKLLSKRLLFGEVSLKKCGNKKCGERFLKQIYSLLVLWDLFPWRARFLSLFFGGLASLALPPVFAQPLLWIAIPGFFLLLEKAKPKAAFWVGWWFGLGYFTVGLYWIAFALGVEIERFWWLVPFTVLGLPSVLAVFTGSAAFLFSGLGSFLFSSSLMPLSRMRRVLLLCLLLSLSEWARGHVLTGFPWNLLAYSWSWSLPFSQGVAYFGSYGLTFLTFCIASGPLFLLPKQGKKPCPWNKILLKASLGLMILGSFWALGALRLYSFPTQYQDDVGLRLVQPSIPQKIKWQQERRGEIFETMLSLSRLPSERLITHIIWPEAALPFFVADSAFALSQIGTVVPKEGAVILGTPRRDLTPQGLTLKNAVIVVEKGGQIQGVYDKRHLVPFGEYVPLRSFFPNFVQKVTAGGIDYSPGEGDTLLNIPGSPVVRPLVCYEGIFPGSAVSQKEERPSWFLSLTNDGWFGDSFGPYQHLQMTRFRAIEEGIPVVRVANNGISAVIDSVGRVLDTLPLDQKGVIDCSLPRPLSCSGAGLYARYGDAIFFVLAIFVAFILFIPIQHKDSDF